MNDVQVITAGGAANVGSNSKKNKKKRNKKKHPASQQQQQDNNNNNESGRDETADLKTGTTTFHESPTRPTTTKTTSSEGLQNDSPDTFFALELEESTRENEDSLVASGTSFNATHSNDSSGDPNALHKNNNNNNNRDPLRQVDLVEPVKIEDLYQEPPKSSKKSELFWLFFCFLGIMASFVCYGLLLEYTTSGGRKLHELSFLFVTSGLYTLTAAAGRYVRAETPTTIPPARFAILGLTSMGSTFCSVRSLRYVIYPIQVLAKSCKPVPVMLMGAFMGKRYNLRKYINVMMIVLGVALFMGGGDKKGKKGGGDDEEKSSSSQFFGILLLFISLCFDGGTGAYEDKLMSVHSVQPFDLMYNIQLGKTILAGVSLLVLNELHIFLQMCQEMGLLLVALGLSGALGQVFIFVTIAKFGALTCSIIGLARKVTTLVASIYFYGHNLNGIQFTGLCISVGSMVMNFMGKSKKGGHGHGHGEPPKEQVAEEMQSMIDYRDEPEEGDVELAARK